MFTGESRPNQKTLRFFENGTGKIYLSLQLKKKKKEKKRIHFSRNFASFLSDSWKIFFLRFN